uniref:Ice-binding protein n=1 Tax=Rhabditophanes sp. KR3021 TaxID=114890 RepID=A0AC35UHV8_9BILA
MASTNSFNAAAIIFLLSTIIFNQANGCTGSSGLNPADSKIIEDPTIVIRYSPPVSWTYPSDAAITANAALPGQANSVTQAQTNGQNDITSTMRDALTDVGINAQAATITVTFNPFMANDCFKTLPADAAARPTEFFIVENNCVASKAQIANAALWYDATTPAKNCIDRSFTTALGLTITDVIVETTIKITDVTGTVFTMRQLGNTFLAKLTFGKSVLFHSAPVIS